MRKRGLCCRLVSIRLSMSLTFVYCIHTAEDIVILLSGPVAPSFWFFFNPSAVTEFLWETLQRGGGSNAQCLHGTAPLYFADELRLSADSEAGQRLRSSSSSSLNVRHTGLSTLGERAFKVTGPRVWNDSVFRNRPEDLPFQALLHPTFIIHSVSAQ